MAGKTLKIRADSVMHAQLVAALRVYAEAAYPPGGSECGQAAREALLNVALQLEAAGGETVQISRRVRPRLKAAIDYYAEQDSSVDPQNLLDLLD